MQIIYTSIGPLSLYKKTIKAPAEKGFKNVMSIQFTM